MYARSASQHGLVTTDQLQRARLTEHDRYRARLDGRLVVVRRGVGRVGGIVVTWESEVLAAVLAAGPGAVASYRTAALLWGLVADRRAGAGPEPVHVSSARALRLSGVRAHRQGVPRAQRSVTKGIPVTTPERTILDLAAKTDPDQLARLVDVGLRHQVLTLARLWLVYGQASRSRTGGVRTLRLVLADRLPGFDPGANEWERHMDRLWDRLGLPPAQRQFRIRLGSKVYRPDRAIVELRIAVDWNGYRPHGERALTDYDSDRRGDLAAAGWFPLDFTSKSTPGQICRVVHAVVAQRRAELGAALEAGPRVSDPGPASFEQ